jgi:hypothetical protein
MKGNNRSFVHAIRGPITLITVGVLFALNNFTPYGFDKTWPVLLIVFGLLSLLRRGIEPVPPPPPTSAFPPPYPYPPQASYAQSTYAQPAPPASGPAKGGFGASAPPRPADNAPVWNTPPEPSGPTESTTSSAQSTPTKGDSV